MEKLKIALCGCVGHAEKFGNMIQSYEETELAVVWDDEPERGQATADVLGVPFEADFDRMLSQYHPDGVMIIATNNWHKELTIKAADAGANIFLEKPLCLSVDDAYEMRDAVKRNHVKFYMTDPFVRADVMELKKLIDDGVLGEITGARFRLATAKIVKGIGRKTTYDRSIHLGGIMADVGGHMVHIAHYLFGKPEGVSAVNGFWTEKGEENNIEENCVAILTYPHGKLVELDCSWVSGGVTDVKEVYGTLGWAQIPTGTREDSPKVIYQVGDEAPVTLEGDDLPEAPLRHVRYWVTMMTEDKPNEIVGVDPLSNSGVSIDNAVEFVEILDAVYRSAERGPVALR